MFRVPGSAGLDGSRCGPINEQAGIDPPEAATRDPKKGALLVSRGELRSTGRCGTMDRSEPRHWPGLRYDGGILRHSGPVLSCELQQGLAKS